MSAPLPDEVAKLLGILSGYAGQQPTPPVPQPPPPPPPPPPAQQQQQSRYYPNAVDLSSLLQGYSIPQSQPPSQPSQQSFNYAAPTIPYHTPSLHSTPSIPSTPLETPPPAPPRPAPVDPSTITTYPRALSYITKTLSTPQFIAKIRQMKASQHSMEHQWHSERELLISRQSNRHSSSAQLSSLLASLPGCGQSAQAVQVHMPSEEENKKELREYDLKIHKKVKDMVRMMENELAGLGVPFFCGGKGGKVKSEGGEMEVEELKRCRERVMDLLEDLAAEEE
ncbi:hypothetical protein BJ508DRAFT_364331 [Ascobolus immersus RN42]|uniref:Uncharacterized protein n=1 Tax=Ascobolus immersus RN42 TaxID=1160509 RepID=A0A3N4HUZ3_ASCIM|nr:hypothetical protein BJ508DRAFT_364331 [Ascobolus immersus RN42]